MSQLSPGETAPTLELKNQDGTVIRLADLRDSTVVVYFYPKAFTPGCTAQACDFRDNLSALKSHGVRVLGVSGDEVAQLRDFADEYQLNYDLLSDPGSDVAKAWGAWGEKQVNGVDMVGPLRTTVVVSEAGTITDVQYNVSAEGSVRQVRETLGL